MKNECSIVRDLLPLYIENMASAESREFVETHLSNCPECNEIYQSMTETGNKEIEDGEEARKSILPLRIVKRKLLCKRIVTSLVAVVLSVALLIGAGTLAYNIVDEQNKKAEIDYGTSQWYSLEDRKTAVDEILDSIYAMGFGYDIISIRFAGDAECLDEWNDEKDNLVHEYDWNDFMVFYVDMKTPLWIDGEALDQNTYYAQIKWVVARTNGNSDLWPIYVTFPDV